MLGSASTCVSNVKKQTQNNSTGMIGSLLEKDDDVIFNRSCRSQNEIAFLLETTLPATADIEKEGWPFPNRFNVTVHGRFPVFHELLMMTTKMRKKK